MGDNTGISWATHTWNPWQGCHKVWPSGECKYCYMFREKKRYGQDPNVVVRSKDNTFYSPRKKFKNGKWKSGDIVFVCSWSDFFIDEADEWRDDAWQIMREIPEVIFLLLTKQTKRIKYCLPDDWGNGWDNVWLGCTVGLQEHMKTLDDFLAVPSKIHFVSAEPLLEKLDFDNYIGLIDWIIVGAESGSNRREFKEGWVRDIEKQCLNVKPKVPLFYKQVFDSKGKKVECPFLDGRQYIEYPAIK